MEHFISSKDTADRPHISTPIEQIVGIGHSLGGVAMSVLADFASTCRLRQIEPRHHRIYLAHTFRFKTLILVDPFIFPGKPEDLLKLMEKFTKAAFERQDVWPTKAEARKALKWRKWDPRVVDVYVVRSLHEYTPSHVVNSI